MLELLTTREFAGWFGSLDERSAEDVATALDVVERLGPEQAPPESRESLLWYEHDSATNFLTHDALAWALEGWGGFRDYARRVLAALESERFRARVAELDERRAARVMLALREIRRVADPRLRWSLELASRRSLGPSLPPDEARAALRRTYFDALEAAGFTLTDVPVHSLALRELTRRAPAPAYRLLYGVDAERGRALVVLGEWLDRRYYGDTVRRAERIWQRFLAGTLAEFGAFAAR
jgi:hypothetical protein